MPSQRIPLDDFFAQPAVTGRRRRLALDDFLRPKDAAPERVPLDQFLEPSPTPAAPSRSLFDPRRIIEPVEPIARGARDVAARIDVPRPTSERARIAEVVSELGTSFRERPVQTTLQSVAELSGIPNIVRGIRAIPGVVRHLGDPTPAS